MIQPALFKNEVCLGRGSLLICMQRVIDFDNIFVGIFVSFSEIDTLFIIIFLRNLNIFVVKYIIKNLI